MIQALLPLLFVISPVFAQEEPADPIVMQPEPNEIVMPQDQAVKKDAPAKEVTEPESPQEEKQYEIQTESKAPEKTVEKGAYIEDDDTVLPSPTADFDAYEEARLKRFQKTRESRWSCSLAIEPRAFRRTDFRKPTATHLTAGKSPSEKSPNFIGILVGLEKYLFKSFGTLGLGIEGGVYSAAGTEGYNNTIFGLPAIGPYLMYQLKYWENQPFIPFAKAQYEVLFQAFRYEGSNDGYISRIIRMEGGGLINLGFLEKRTSGGSLYSDFKIKKVYVMGSLTKTVDSSKKQIDLSETSWRIGARFDF